MPDHHFRPTPVNVILRMRRRRAWRIPLEITPTPEARALSLAIFIYGFAAVIALGTILLILPFSSKSGDWTSFLDALFTATSATCVTGLTVVGTESHWSTFGQGVILALVQVGGFGFMISATLLWVALGRRIGLRQRLLIAESLGLDKVGGVVRLVKRFALVTLIIESAGAGLLFLNFSSESSTGTALWHAFFQSISAFNNAGFTNLGQGQSLIPYQTDVGVLMVTAVLIFSGGISFLVLADVARGRRFDRFSLDTKIVLVTTGGLLAIGTIIFLITEYSNAETLGPLGIPQKILVAFFHSVSPRTAGFEAVHMGDVMDYTLFFTIVLMFIGGAAGSTAGGIKVNTFGMLIATIASSLREREHPRAFGREFDPQQIYRALTVSILALTFITLVVLVLQATEDFDFLDLLFETVSAFGTVGLSTGITPELSAGGKLLIILTMFVGRLGPLTLALILFQRQKPTTHRYPHDVVRIG